jgi:hypothetical protein
MLRRSKTIILVEVDMHLQFPKWQKMEEDLLAQGTIPAVVDWPE